MLHAVITMSYPPIDAWTHYPWGGEIVGDRMYGRSAGDMKAGLIANFFALKAILDSGFPLKGNAMLQSMIDEEVGGGGGILACLDAGYSSTYCNNADTGKDYIAVA